MDEQTPSKTQRKRQMEALQDLGERLVALNKERLAQMDLPDSLRAAVEEARRIRSHGALRRQMQYIGKLMRSVDAEPIRARFAAWDGNSREHAAWLHRLERLREGLVADERAADEVAREFAGADLQRLRSLARSARKEAAEGRPPRSYRALFDALKEIIPPPGAAGAACAEEEPE
ncbi:MAG TPA: ribosome biogenesis factor YjgA [Burkholderiales bacterium]|nr:ribosome biogenesis factor YjgA [Burkholderiales bacterium]